MELSFAKCKSIADTLPIGLYTGRRVPVEVDEKEGSSFYSLMEDKIVISYPVIAARMKQVAECDEEEAVRSMLYHEVSHAILTPVNLTADVPINIFEDERIESVLRNYYHGVNFRKQIYDLHGGHAPKATDAESAFFNAVRFGLSGGKIQKEILRVLKEYAKLNRNSPKWNGKGQKGYYDYKEDVHDLYRMIEREFKSNPEQFNEGESKDSMQNMDNTSSGNKQKKSEKSQQQDGDEEQEFTLDRDHDMPEMARETLERMVGQSLSKKPNVSDDQLLQLEDFKKTAETIISNFNKKNSGGSGINAYSGVFSPRNVVRKDYRFFDRAMTTQGNNKFGTCHLNLIIDCSGSFCGNVDITNGILAVLSEIERKNRNFSMDVAFINHEFHVCKTVRDRKMTAWGGNSIPINIKEIMLSFQKPQTLNYNIILFDGDAICDWGGNEKENCRKFGAFDMKQTTLITDPDNEEYMNPPFTSTKVVVTKNYTDELIKHITNALMIAFG